MLLKNVFDDNKIVQEIYNNDRFKRYTMFVVGVLLQALAFNIFILPSKMTFGVSGLAVILNGSFHFTPSVVIFIANILLIAASLIFLGKTSTGRTVLGSLLYPLFVQLTVPLVSMIDLGSTESVIIALSGAVVNGVGSGFCFKAGFTSGGSDVMKQIVAKYGKKSMGQATIYVEGVIVSIGLFFFGWQAFIYSILSIAVISYLTDKVILGISEYKTFQIITDKEKEVKQFILNQIHHGVTVINVEGGFSGHNKKILLCTIPSKEYFLFKEGVHMVDKKAFFIVTDTYEVKGGK